MKSQFIGDAICDYLRDFAPIDEEHRSCSNSRSTALEKVNWDSTFILRYSNEFWTSRQRQGHSLHEISYRACFKSELPSFFIELLSQPGDLVYDPFMGRGTTVLEAALLNRMVAGNDVNPLSRTLIEPRLEVPCLTDIEERLESLNLNRSAPLETDLSMFFSEKTHRQIIALRNYLEERKREGKEDSTDRWIRMVATNRLTGHSKGFFSVYTLPPNQAVSSEAQKKINLKRNQTPQDKDIKAIILKKSLSLQRDLTESERHQLRSLSEKARYFNRDAREKCPLQAESVSLVVTSPPFLNTVQYQADNWLRCWFNGMDANEIGKTLSVTSSLAGWTEIMTEVFRELGRLLKPGGWIAFEVGEVQGGKLLLDEIVAPIGMKTGLQCQGILVNDQSFTKTSNCWGVSNNRKGTNTNRVVLFQKKSRESSQ